MVGSVKKNYFPDLSAMATCLNAIRTSQNNGLFDGHTELLNLLNLFEKDLLKKLYVRTLKIFSLINLENNPDVVYIGGDFSERNFSKNDFHVGYLDLTSSTESGYFYGDFNEGDFFYDDFYVGFLDQSGAGYEAIFQTIWNILQQINTISDVDSEYIYSINEALQEVLDAFQEIQAYLNEHGLNPCVPVSENYRQNTKGVYLQVAGSDGLDGIAAGFHLRWSLTGELGNNHIPKGNYFNQNSQGLSGFNRADDFVHIFRTPYNNTHRFVVDFDMDRPLVNFLTRTWVYKITKSIDGQLVTNEIRLIFNNPALYKLIATQFNPSTRSAAFLKAYPDVILIKIMEKSAFLVNLVLGSSNTVQSKFKVEGRCHIEGEDSIEDTLIKQTIKLRAGQTTVNEIKAENLVSLRFRKTSDGQLKRFEFETYHDFAISRPESAWTELGNGFGISLDDQQVFDKLENSSYSIDNLWPQYNDGTRVRVANYHSKWLDSSPEVPSLKETVAKYLLLSETDPKATEYLTSDGDTEQMGINISYLDILNFQATDYHMARMLGVGYIDAQSLLNVTDKYVYQLRYSNKKEAESSQLVNYRYTSLPVSTADKLIPEKPKLYPLEYKMPGADDQANNIFDTDGYTNLDNVRIVNLRRAPFEEELVNDTFFADFDSEINYNIFQHPRPIFYGVEYRAEEQTTYVKPEITYDPGVSDYLAYDDFYPNGIPETTHVFDEEKSLFIHFERNSGIHYYAIYGINWFSRASVLSDEVATDETVFEAVNTLVPPTDVAVQYIQKENTLVFTTSKEQEWLAGRADAFPGQDISFTRINFNWLDITDISRLGDAYLDQLSTIVKADQINAHFHPELPLELIGRIKDVFPVAGEELQLKLITGSYRLMDGTLIEPSLDPQQFFRFQDSLLSTTNGRYRILYLESGTEYPIITIEKVVDTEVVTDAIEPDRYGSNNVHLSPEIGSRFTTTENLGNDLNWEPIESKIALKTFGDINNPNIEVVSDSEGNETKLWIGGLHDMATVTPLFGTDPATDLPGCYRVVLNSTDLAPHQQINIPFELSDAEKNTPASLHTPHVEWYKGLIRMPLQSGDTELKQLEVLRIEQSNPLSLYVYDPGFAAQPIAVSSTMGNDVKVNFHPGYRTYFFAEPGGNHTFNGTQILPEQGESTRKTLVGLQSQDTSQTGNRLVSKVSMPSILMARRIEEPVVFDAPTYQNLKVRPDATGKAAFTFDVKIKPTVGGMLRRPFGFMFYRTTAEDVLEALYEPTTIMEIKNALGESTEDSAFYQRYLELVNLIFDANEPGQFKIYDALPQAYGFPIPDKAGLTLVGDGINVKKAKYLMAIHQTLLPLTEQTPLFNFIKTGYNTGNELPSIRDVDGNLLEPNSTDFNPFPMVRKYTKPEESNTTYLRFTDYFLNGASRNLYFFAGSEMSDALEDGPLSPFAGPVTILQSMPSGAPVISRIKIDTDQFFVENGMAVNFYVAPISPEDRISKIRVYRSFNELDTLALQSMDDYFDVEVNADDNGELLVIDSFDGVTNLPYGKNVYYRLAGIRVISNEDNLPEDVLTWGSEVITVKLIDSKNPEAPDLNYVQAENKLIWQPTAFNSIYHVYKQNNGGNWEKVFSVEPPLSNAQMEYVIPEPLVAFDEDGNRLYYRYKVQVQNSIGLYNLSENEITISSN